MKKDGFEAGFRGFAGRVTIEAEQTIREVRASGDLAYCWSTISVSMTPLQGGETTRRSGEVLTIFRRSPAGRWLLFRDANLLTAR